MATCHVRSISLPTRSHPLKESIEELLCNLKASQSSSSVCNKLAGLKELYECVDDFLQLPLTQQNLSNECAEHIMNGSLKVLDICSTTRDIFSQAKESIKELESCLRRSRCKESGVATEIDAYMAARRILNKEINKCLRNLKRKEKNLRAAASSVEAVNILRSVEEISVSVFDDRLSFISQPKSKPSGWSIVSKLMQSKPVSCQSNVQAKEAGKINAELLVLKSSKGTDLAQVQNVLKGLVELESNLQEMEEEMDCIYRRMVKARVTLLNILTH